MDPSTPPEATPPQVPPEAPQEAAAPAGDQAPQEPANQAQETTNANQSPPGWDEYSKGKMVDGQKVDEQGNQIPYPWHLT